MHAITQRESVTTAGSSFIGTQANGNWQYDSLGTNTRHKGNPNNGFQYRFSTNPRDTVSGLDYYGYRWYDPSQKKSHPEIRLRNGVN